MNPIKYKLVVLDDELDLDILFRLVFTDLIDEGKINYQFFSNAKDCLNFLHTSQNLDEILFILSDINMPRMDGYSFLKEVKQSFTSLKVIMISAYFEQDYVDKAKGLGAIDYLTKPINFNQLRKMIMEELEDRRGKQIKT